MYPKSSEIIKTGLEIIYFGYFFILSMYENYKYIKKYINFRIQIMEELREH